MRRRRSRLPIILIGCLALLLGASLGMAAAGVRPVPAVMAWLGQGASPTPADTGPAAPATSGGPDGGAIAALDSADPSASLAAGPTQTAAPAAPAATGSPAAAGGSGATPAPSAPAGSPVPSGVAPQPSLTTVSGGTAHAVYNGSRAKKVVALTFDDGYSPVALRQILAILKREKIVATFFPYGWAVHNDPAGWKMVVAAGYPIGNHTLTHSILTTLTPDQVTTEMTRGRATIDLYSGAKSTNLMRPPGGAFNAATARAIAKAGYPTIVMWDVDTFDWQGPSAATILARATKGTNGSIVLMHSGPLNTPKALPAIIANYRARGFGFVTVPELLAAK